MLARLAVDERYGGFGYGKELLAEAIDISMQSMRLVGGYGIILDAKDGAVELSLHHGFEIIDEAKFKLFMPRNSANVLISNPN